MAKTVSGNEQAQHADEDGLRMKHGVSSVMMYRFLAIAVLTATAFVSTLSLVITGDDNQPPYKITTKRDDDRVEVRAEKDKAIFIIHSHFGISNAAIERTGEKWPDALILRLHLKGLEGFRISNGKSTLGAAVSSQNDKQRVRLWKDDDENSPLNEQSPFWMEIRMVGDDGKPGKSIPLKDGYFEMQLPKAFFEDIPKSIVVNWIDFYRN